MKTFPLVALTLLLLTCAQSAPEPAPLSTLHRLTLPEIVDWQRTNGLDVSEAEFVSLRDEPIGATEQAWLDGGVAGFDFYSDGERIRKVLVRPQNYNDNIIRILRSHADYHPAQAGFELTDEYCDSIPATIAGVIERDQGVRTGDLPGSMMDVDAENQAIMVSIFERCPNAFAEMSNKQVSDLWFVAQHSDAELMSYYYPWFYRAVRDGRIRESQFALMIDRLLMYHDYPQEYGSQISNGALYPVRDSARLDELRAGIGLGPIAEYLARFDL